MLFSFEALEDLPVAKDVKKVGTKFQPKAKAKRPSIPSSHAQNKDNSNKPLIPEINPQPTVKPLNNTVEDGSIYDPNNGFSSLIKPCNDATKVSFTHLLTSESPVDDRGVLDSSVSNGTQEQELISRRTEVSDEVGIREDGNAGEGPNETNLPKDSEMAKETVSFEELSDWHHTISKSTENHDTGQEGLISLREVQPQPSQIGEITQDFNNDSGNNEASAPVSCEKKRRVSTRKRNMTSSVQEDAEEHALMPPASHDVSGTGGSRRQLRKRSVVHKNKQIEETADEDEESNIETSQNDDIIDDGGGGGDDDADDGDYLGGDEVKLRCSSRSKHSSSKNQKSVNNAKVRPNKRKNSEEDNLTEKAAKRKFSHSTRRKRRQLDDDVLAMPEDEIDVSILTMRQLILLAEVKEKRTIKEAAQRKHDAADQSNAGLNGDKDGIDDMYVENLPIINYHSFMKRSPAERWSKSDTELFFKGMRQFGTDFAMIQKLFPGKTRHQVKLKFKKEEREHPMEVADALFNRSSDHTHYQMVMDRIKVEAAAKEAEAAELNAENEDNEEIDPKSEGSHEWNQAEDSFELHKEDVDGE
ncbi:transcription factor TFIIIB component B'' isoform X1 [Amborella trichopoda]|uniref:transcription factor TFIIIB component B'' isoform X1 n=1 Tax=Amborella trichopoda TaxID=13333 RepID=UPI0009BE8213|nr:transcription factor TFIIIB component B'' isoform X1 [Amborella trichopoda]|eukprot:XP_020518932.1 transcription factor TFIIIB component B'' isoform X1 [Amborella trichopoda]